MGKILALLGMCLIVGVCYLLSENKKEINWKSVGCAFIGQVFLAVLFIKTPLWKVIELLAKGVTWLLAQAQEGITFVFSDLTNVGGFNFFINSLMPIVFISSVMGMLFHFGIIQKFISIVGRFVAKVLGVDTVVACNGVTNMFLGQTESLFITRSYLPSAKDSVIFATLVGGMTSISVSVVGLYTSYGASMEWILVSMPLTVFSTFVLTQILMPTKYDEKSIELDVADKGANVLETMMNYGMTGFKSVIGISVALMVFLSTIAMVDSLLSVFGVGITLQSILGVVFYPIAVLMGVSGEEVRLVAELLATKLCTNETVAFASDAFAQLSTNAKAMMTVVNCGFAGFGSIGILIGGYSAIAPTRVKTVAKLGVKALLTATAVNILTGMVIAVLL